MRLGLTVSAGGHVGLLVLAAVGLPALYEPPPPVVRPIPVEVRIVGERSVAKGRLLPEAREVASVRPSDRAPGKSAEVRPPPPQERRAAPTPERRTEPEKPDKAVPVPERQAEPLPERRSVSERSRRAASASERRPDAPVPIGEAAPPPERTSAPSPKRETAAVRERPPARPDPKRSARKVEERKSASEPVRGPVPPKRVAAVSPPERAARPPQRTQRPPRTRRSEQPADRKPDAPAPARTDVAPPARPPRASARSGPAQARPPVRPVPSKDRRDRAELAALASAARAGELDSLRGAVADAPGTEAAFTGSDIDRLMTQIGGCWRIIEGLRDSDRHVVTLHVELGRDRRISSIRSVDPGEGQGYRAAEERARRALRDPDCERLNVPDGKFEAWRSLELRFDPSRL